MFVSQTNRRFMSHTTPQVSVIWKYKFYSDYSHILIDLTCKSTQNLSEVLLVQNNLVVNGVLCFLLLDQNIFSSKQKGVSHKMLTYVSDEDRKHPA